jgi:hypothetical protein
VAIDSGKQAKNKFKEKNKGTFMLLSVRIFHISYLQHLQLGQRYRNAKKFWEFQRLQENSGFGCNNNVHVSTSLDEIWEFYNTVNFFLITIIFLFI